MAKPIRVHGLSRRMPVARAASSVLRAVLLDLLEKIPDARGDGSKKGIHDLRVAVKRFREAFRLFRPILRKKTFRKHREWIEDGRPEGHHSGDLIPMTRRDGTRQGPTTALTDDDHRAVELGQPRLEARELTPGATDVDQHPAAAHGVTAAPQPSGEDRHRGVSGHEAGNEQYGKRVSRGFYGVEPLIRQQPCQL